MKTFIIIRRVRKKKYTSFHVKKKIKKKRFAYKEDIRSVRRAYKIFAYLLCFRTRGTTLSSHVSCQHVACKETQWLPFLTVGESRTFQMAMPACVACACPWICGHAWRWWGRASMPRRTTSNLNLASRPRQIVTPRI